MLLRALDLLKNRDARLQVDLVGPATDLEYQRQLENYIIDRKLEKSVRLLGWRDDVPELMAASHLMVLCSRIEGVPQSILEAMQLGLPVLGTRAGGIPDVISDGHTGWLVDVDDHESMAACIANCMDSPSLTTRVSNHAQEFVREYHTIEQWCKQHQSLIYELSQYTE